MLKYYFISALRNIRKNYYFSSINVVGQAIGLAGFLLIMQYVLFQYSYDKNFNDSENIFRITHEAIDESGNINRAAVTFSRVGYELRQSTSIDEVVRIHKLFNVVKVGYHDKMYFESKVISSDSNFFNVFNLPFKYGVAEVALNKPNSIVITKEMSSKYFGEENPVGKELVMEGGYGFWGGEGLNDKVTYIVTGVLDDLPLSTHLEFDFLISLNLFSNLEGELNNWGDDLYTYVKVDDVFRRDAIESALPLIAEKYKPKKGITLSLQPLEDIHLYSQLHNEFKANGNSRSVMLLGSIAFLIVLIASANYINFATANAINKQREIAIRKIFWARRSQLICQVLIETLVINTASFFLGIVIIISGKFYFNNMLGIDVMKILMQVSTWVMIFGILLAVTAISGIYPAYVISKMSIIKTGSVESNTSIGLGRRSILIVLQFTISMIVVGGTIVLFRQMSLMRQGDIGIDINNTLVLHGPMVTSGDDSVQQARLSEFKIEVGRLSGVKEVAGANFLPGKEIKGRAVGYVRKAEDNPDNAKTYYFTQVDYSFIRNLQMKILAGRSFDERFLSDKDGIVINKATCDQLNFSSPEAAIGRKIIYRMQSKPTIIGVVDNFHQESFKHDFRPTIFELSQQASEYLFIKLPEINSIKLVENVWRKTFPESPYSFFFLRDFYSNQYAEDDTLSDAVSGFAIVSIFISTIGLLGLIYFISLSKTKEIGVRKALGAKFINVFIVLSKGVGVITLVSSALAVPLIFVISSTWLEEYAFRINITWWMLLLPVCLLAIIATSVIGIQALIANRSNPILSLREK